jgi:hypothetical protein
MATQLAVRTIVVSGVLLVLASPSAVYAAYTSTLTGSNATMTGDGASDTLTITLSGGLVRHNRFGDPGFTSDSDFDTSTAGNQTLSSAGGISINAGGGNDSIAIGSGLSVDTIDGGAGTDTLDYSAYTTDIFANLGLGTDGLSATLAGNQEVPTTVHAGTGTATITNYSVTARTFDINVAVSDLAPADVTGFHIHRAAVGVNGPIIINFSVASLVPSGTGFTFTATAVALPATSEAAFLGGATYVNIHTSTFPGGAIRGQLFSTGNVNLAIGEATGTSSVANIENVTGGTGGDNLVGNSGVNTITGGSGNDWIVGGPGNDTLNGDAGADVLVWSTGDGSDVDEGGANADTVQVNGSISFNDLFVISPNGARVDFDRISPGPFSLDIGTAETLIVNSIGGSDSVTVNDLSGVADLTTLNLNGFDGNDTFTYVATSAGAFSFNVHGGSGTDTLQGPNGATTWNVTAANQGNIGGLVTAFSFVETLSGGGGSDTFNVKAFATGPLTVTGGAGTDTLNYNAEWRAVAGDTTPPDGVIDSPGVQSVTFTQSETVNITNPQPTMTISDLSVGEANTSVIFTVSLTNASNVTVTVNFTTADGTAIAPGDYASQSGMLTFNPGQIVQPITVAINGDAVVENTETFAVNLSSPSAATITDSQGVGTIVDNDAVAFTDPSLTPGVTLIKVVHITQLRARVNAVRAARGLDAVVFSDSSLSVGETPIRAVHILELRAALAEAYDAAKRTAPTYSDPVPGTGVVVMATAIMELRAAVIAIE